ncbi:sulfite exporter TauE/SafE family protein [Salinimonas marina]|uniref:Probable membrane transporter protein n=1 Tax=Salinimonas marina TaxID=2785918 RepID=A0A7S9DZ49_9ALTE|nr:sulfite exporter TauE/SafE family protein [Salinimonas marina]QPG06318.1 sulfite exporter TauE/SafE family protein [Salinimonas marina]
MSWDWAGLLVAGFFGGVLNSIAGGGSFITFPMLLMAGVPAISANATNTFASCAGYLSGAYAFKEELRSHRSVLPALVMVSTVGGLVGAWSLLQTPETVFQEAIPWLLLFATLLFIFGEQLNRGFRMLGNGHARMAGTARAALVVLLLLIGIYGGFFNAGLGIISLSYLVLAGYTNINVMNAMKLLISCVVSMIAIVIFVVQDQIAWVEGALVLTGTLAGGYLAARISRLIAAHYIRYFVMMVSVLITSYFFIDIYAN